MSFALKELSRLLASEPAVVGAVVGVDGTLVRVATARGAVTVRTLDALGVGDRVLVRHGFASKSPLARQTYPV